MAQDPIVNANPQAAQISQQVEHKDLTLQVCWVSRTFGGWSKTCTSFVQVPKYPIILHLGSAQGMQV